MMDETTWSGVVEMYFIHRIMNAENYIKILKENILPPLSLLRRKAMFQYDNDQKHSAKKSDFLKEQLVKMHDRPSISPTP